MNSSAQKWPDHLVIVRHAESNRNRDKEIASARGELFYGGKIRDMEVELTELGVRQAMETGVHLGRRFKFDRVFASPFHRTLQTAQLIAKGFPYTVAITEDERLREIDFGVLDGLTKKGMAEHYPGEVERRKKLGKYWFRPIAGESWPDVGMRVHSFLATLTREAAGNSVLIVCHSVVVMMFRKLLERMTESQILEIDADKSLEVANCGITHYEFDEGAGNNGKLLLREYNGIYYDLKQENEVHIYDLEQEKRGSHQAHAGHLGGAMTYNSDLADKVFNDLEQGVLEGDPEAIKVKNRIIAGQGASREKYKHLPLRKIPDKD